MKLTKNKYRNPSNHALATALEGAVSILTPDGNNVLVTPACARQLALNLYNLSLLAEGAKAITETEPVDNRPAVKLDRYGYVIWPPEDGVRHDN